MAFDDSLIGSDDFDPAAATESLIRQQTAEALPGGPLDVRMLNTRLARKLAQPSAEPPPVIEASVTAPSHKTSTSQPDFSAQAIEPSTAVDPNVDFSAQAVEPPMIGPAAPPATNNSSWTDYPVEFGKGVAEGAKGMGAAGLKGAAALTVPTLAPSEMLDELGRAKDMTASQRAKLMGRVLREISDRGLQMDYNAALRRISQGGDAAKEIEALRPKFEANNKIATTPIKEQPLYKAGEAVDEFGKEALAPRPGFEPGKSWTRDIGSGAGSMAAGIGVSLIPGIGPAAAGTLFTAAGVGEAAERAVKGGATEDQIKRAALLGGAAGATDMLDTLLPFLGGTGRALGFIKRVGIAAVKGAILEGGQEGVQQLMQNAIAQGIYKPDQDLFEDVPRSMAIAAILGGAGGGISGAATRQPAPAGTPGLAPPPGAGPSPGDGGPSPSSPEDIADFVRRAQETAPPQPETEPDPAAMSDAERMAAFTEAREAFGGASMDEILRGAGFDPATMDEQAKIDETIRAGQAKMRGASDTDASRNADASAAPETPKGEESHLRYATLREAGWSDEDIDAMSPAQRKKEFDAAIADGIKPGKAMSKHKKRAPKAATPLNENERGQPKASTDWSERLGLKAKTDQQLRDLIAGAKQQADRFEATLNDPIDSKRHPKETLDHYREQARTAREGIAAAEKELADRDTTGLRGMGSGMAGAMGENLRAHLWSRVEAGQIEESNGMGPSALLQGAKMIRGRGGLKDRKAFDAYVAEQSKLTPGTPGFQQGMRDLVEKYSPPKGDGTRAKPVDLKDAGDVQAAGEAASGDYTHAQGEANNRKLGHAKWHGMRVSIEVPKGGVRKMQNPKTGEPVEVTHAGAAYGYFPGTVGADGQHVDFILGDHPEADTAYIIDEKDRDTGKFRQHKVVGGVLSERDAFAAYVQISSKGPETVGAISPVPVRELPTWLAGDTTRPLKMTEAPVAAATDASKGSPAVSRNGGANADGGPGATIAEPAKGSTPQGAQRNTSNEVPLSLNQFIASKGGLRPDPELNAIGLAGDHRVQIPGKRGFFGLIRPTGHSLDQMREMAEEAGYLRGEANKTSTIRDLLDAIDTELRGQPRHAEGEEGRLTKRQRGSLKESSAAARDKAIQAASEDIAAEYTDLPEGLLEQAATIMADERLSVDDAVEQAAMRAINEDPDYEISENDIVATYGEGAFDEIQARPAPEDGRDAARAVEEEPRPAESEEAVEDGTVDEDIGEEGGEGGPLIRPYDFTADRTKPTQLVPLPMELAEFAEITDEWAALFTDPQPRTNLETKLKNGPFIPLEEAQARIDQWAADAAAQAEDSETRQANSTKTILSLYDLTGNWARPWAEAGYNVLMFDIQSGQDVNDFSVEYFTDNYDITDVYGILIAQPCTDFATSGSKHFAAKDARGDTAKSIELVHQSLRTVEYFRPKFWVLENPVSRIERLTGLPPWRLLFNPNNFGDPYTKKTVLWGKFNADLPTANVEPTEGSKMHKKYGGKSQATKNARSATPEGFAYAFFKANNYADQTPAVRLEMDYPEISGAVKQAVEAGLTEENIREIVDYDYGDYEYDRARGKLIAAVKSKEPSRLEKTLARSREYADKINAREDARMRERMAELEAANPDTLDDLKGKLVVFASGMSRIGDFKAGAHAWGHFQSRGIGVDVGELSRPAMEEIARAVVDKKVQLFVDSGAFSLFRRGLRNRAAVDAERGDLFGDQSAEAPKLEPLDFDNILAKYEDIEAAIGNYNEAEEDITPPMFVMPDIVGDQSASLDLIEQYKKWIGTTAQFDVSRPIVPIQKGELSLADAYARIVDTLGTDRFIVGIPSNEKAVSNEELLDFLTTARPRRIHFLGAASDKKLMPKLRIVEKARLVLDHLSADANLLRSALYGKPFDGLRSDAIVSTFMERGEPETSRQIAPREQLFVEIEGKRLPLTSFEEASAAYSAAIDATGATATGRTGPKAPQAIITDQNGKPWGYISYNGRVWKGDPKEFDNTKVQMVYDPAGGPDPYAEIGADGKPQLTMAEAPRIGQGEQAQRKADERLKPKVAQRPADEGLFGDGMNQRDLLDMPAKPAGLEGELQGREPETYRQVMQAGAPKEAAELFKRAEEMFSSVEDNSGIADRVRRVIRTMRSPKAGLTDLESALTQLRGTLDYIDAQEKPQIDRLLLDEGYKLDDENEDGFRAYIHSEAADAEQVRRVANLAKSQGFTESAGLRAFKNPQTGERIDIEPGGPETSGHYLFIGKEPNYDLDGATAEIQTSDSDELVPVTLTRDGPWDFNDTYPAPLESQLRALDADGRDPFGQMPPTVEQVAYTLDAAVNELMYEISEIRGVDERIADIREGRAKLKRKQNPEDVIRALQKERAGFAEAIRGIRGTYMDLFGDTAANAMIAEARRRIVQEEGQRDRGVVRPQAAAAQIEEALGEDADKVAPVDIARAAEIMADNPGMPPETAFGQAVAESVVEQGFITEQEAVEAYGEEVQDVLESVHEGAPVSGGDAIAERTAPDEIAAGGAAQAGEPAGGREVGEEVGGAGDRGGPVGTAASGDEAARDQASDTAQDGAAAEDAFNARVDAEVWWQNDLTPYGKEIVVKAAGLPARVIKMAWWHITEPHKKALAAIRGTDADPVQQRDAPTWAEILHALPRLTEGRFAGQADLDAAANLMFEISGKRQPSYGDLTPAQKHEMMDRLKPPASAAQPADITVVAPKNFITDGAGKEQRAAVILANGKMWEFSREYALFGKWNGLGAHARFREEGGHTGYLEVTGYADKSASIHGADYATPAQMRAVRAIQAQAKRTPGFDLSVAYLEEDANIKDAGERDGVQAPVHAGDAVAGPEAVQPVEPERGAGELRPGESGRGEQAVPRADGERAEGSGRVSQGARGKRSDRAGDGGDARLPEGQADDAADGRAKRAARRAANVEGENFVIEPGALDEGRGFKTKARDNIKAIETLHKIEAEGRPATAAEQSDLAKYVGWGGIKNIFPDEQGNYGEGFADLGPRLRELLTDDEYATARRSIQYAHYTAEDIVRAMWRAVSKMGFAEGQVFEPGMGVGNFAGMMPTDIAAKTSYAGIELDHVTARIAKLLYPKWGVRQDDFTKTRLPENNYDLVIGNPPFADVPIKSDRKYPQGFLLHDYFFAKSLDAVRPGGLLAFVTSAGTMNKIDPAARDYLADRADLVGAIRLPDNAFAKNAGTMVTTDIIFLRKRLPGDVPGDRSWTGTTIVSLPSKDGEAKVHVNNYFVANPQMVLGRQDANDRLYPGRYSVKAAPGIDFAEAFTAAIDNLPADIMSPWQDVNADQHAQDFETTEKKEGTYYIGPDGSLFQVNNGVGSKVGQRGKGVENGRTAADMERIKGLIPVRDALRAVYAADLKGDTANAARARAALNKAYDDFVEKHGPINKAVIQTRRPNVIQMESARAEAREEARYADMPFREGSFDARPLLDARTPLSVIARKRQEMRDEFAKTGQPFDEGDFDMDEVPDVIIDKRPNVDPFMDDPESYRLRAIERYDEGTGKGHKSPVFTENVISREVKPNINSVNDALLYSLSQYGRVNVPAMAELMGKTESEIVESLGDKVFRLPGTKDTFQTRDEYLSGNVRKKLELAQKAADRNPDFRRNVAGLEAAQPMPLAPSQIHATLGMPWIPQAEIEKFGLEALGLEKLRVRYTPKLASWTVSGDTDSVSASTTWGTPDRRAPALIEDALNRRNVKIYDKIMINGRESSQLNVAKTEAAQDKLNQIREKFAEWIWSDQERADRLASFYNENFNNLVVREYDGSYLTTPGIASSWSWRPHQKRVIARIIQSGNTYVAHAVGAGKTSEYIGAIMEMRRLGLVRKPMVAVPNHMLAQFTKEWYEQYPTARLAIADDKRFHTDRRKQFIANVAMEDLDAIIITHSSFGMIPVSEKFSNSIIEREIAQYRELLADLKAEGGDTRITRSRVEKQIERLEQRLISKTGRKDQTFTFEEMGVDHLTIDEAHLFRKLDFSTSMSNLKGVSPEGSQMAWDLYVKSLYLDSIRPGRGLVLGSGTPITNTMAELYTLSRYMQPEVLAERGLEKFDAWAGAFGESVSELEQDAAGNYKPVSRFAKFVNVAELSAMVRQVMDVVTSKQLSQYVTRPEIRGGKRQMHLAEKSRALVRFQENLAARMKAIQERKGPPQKGDDIMLSVINDGRHAAIDMRLAGGEASETPSKLEMLVENVFRQWETTKRQPFFKVGKDGKYEGKPAMTGPGTQIIFANLGLSGARGFAVPNYIMAELHRRGVPKNEIAYIYDYKSATQKQRLFNDMNEGKVRILIGSVAKMGVGTNVQRRLTDIHNLDPLWYPADDEQRNGRGIRQGNMNREIGINDYSTKGTYDSTMWGMMEKKARFIQGFFEGDPSLRDMDDLGEASQYEQAKALTTNDPRLIRFTELKQELERANRRKASFENDVYNTRQRRQRAGTEIEHYTQRVEETKKDIAQRVSTRGDDFKGKVGKTEYDKRVDFGDALFKRLEEIEKAGTIQPVKVADIGGFPIYVTSRKSNLLKDETLTDVFMQLNGPSRTREVSYEGSSLGTVRSIESILSGLESDLAVYQERLARASKFWNESKDKANAKFEGDAEIAQLAKQVKDLEAELRADAEPAKPGSQEEKDAERDELADRGDSYMQSILTPLADEKHAEISKMLTAIVRAIAGDIPSVEFHKGLIPLYAPKGYGDMKPSTIGSAGGYKLGTAVLRLALTNNADQMMLTAFHESYHHVEDRLQTPAERELMKAETPRLREWLKGRTRFTAEQLAKLAGYEIRAIAFSWYANERLTNKDAGKGIHIGVRRWFDRLLELLTRIRNGLKGLGFKSYKDVFSDTFEGKVAGRPDQGTGGIQEDELAALGDIFEGLRDRVEQRTGWDFTELRVQIQDKFIRVRHAQDSVPGSVPTSQNTYQAESLYYGRTGERLEQLEKNHFDPLIEEMNARDVTMGELNNFLYARHARERNAAMDEINHPELDPGGRDLRGRGSGMSDQEADDIIANIGANRMPDFLALEARVRTIIDGTRENLVEDGLISEQTADAWAEKYRYYVPLRGFEEGTEDASTYSQGSGFDTRAAETKRAFGRLSKAAGPLQYVMMQAEMAIVRGEKNRVGNTFLRFVRSHPNPRRWTVNRAPVRKAIDPRTGLVTEVADNNYRNRPDVFITKVGGVPVLIQLQGRDGERLVRALKNMGTSNLNKGLRLAHNVTTTMSRLATQWNPNFTLPNFARDVGEAFINLQAQDQQRFVRQFSKHLIPAIGGSFTALRGGRGGRYADAFREFDAAGGRIRFFGLENAEDIATNVSRKLRRLEGGVINNVIRAGEKAAEGMEILNGSIENATRLAAYMAARDVGMSVPDAAMLARNLTVDFNKKGELGNAFNALYMFANASIGGTARIAQALTHKRVRRAAYALVGIGALAAMLAASSGGEDDAGENYYAKIPHWIRDKNLIIMWPKGWGNDGKYIKIPLPYGFSPFFVTGARMAMVAMGKDKPGEAGWAVLHSILDAFNPLGEESSIFGSFLPSALRPGEHIATNKNWNGRPLYPENQWEKHKPDSEQSFRSNSTFSKEAARQMNAASGGSPYKSGWADFHPGSIDHVLEALTGGAGKFVGDVVKTGAAAFHGEPFDATKAPVLRRFYGTANSPETDASAYYKAREEARKSGGQSVRDARRDRSQGVNVEAAESHLQNSSAAVRGEAIFKSADQAMRPLRERRDRIEKNTEMSSEDKRGKVREIEQQMREIQNRARKQYRELRGGS